MTEPIGVSAVVRFLTPVRSHPAGTHALVIGQAPNGRHRYQVMVPGDPLPICPLATDLEVVQGVTPAEWWRRPRSGQYVEPSVEDWDGPIPATMARRVDFATEPDREAQP